MTGGCASSSGAFAIKAAAIRPSRCAWRPASSGKASKMPNVEGPIRIANHAVVAGSCSASGKPPRRKASTSFSFPGLASSRTSNATFTMAISLSSWSAISRLRGPPPSEGQPPLRQAILLQCFGYRHTAGGRNGEAEGRRLAAGLVVDQPQTRPQAGRQLARGVEGEQDHGARLAGEVRGEVCRLCQGKDPSAQVVVDDREHGLARTVGGDRAVARVEAGDGGGHVVEVLHGIDEGLAGGLPGEEEDEIGADERGRARRGAAGEMADELDQQHRARGAGEQGEGGEAGARRHAAQGV